MSSNTSEGDRRLVSSILGVKYSNDRERYLGLPNIIGRNKKISFQILKNKLKKRIKSYNVGFYVKEARRS
ncbi:hypothetical protein J1N35_022832 [Gossypium stocksii]|uniref:Uncharacterized protein n=1 Tax=Gossypium stocksii TaxID=47602 RepID=A0A9D3VHX9_9ROSI|nr:hypothetical protein J1N35_022832 [Gossypium stocksii]